MRDISPVKVWRQRRDRYRYLGKIGQLISFTRVVETPAGFDSGPYWVGMIAVGKGKKVTGQLVEVKDGELKKGTKVRGVLRKTRLGSNRAVIEYGVKFKPVL